VQDLGLGNFGPRKIHGTGRGSKVWWIGWTVSASGLGGWIGIRPQSVVGGQSTPDPGILPGLAHPPPLASRSCIISTRQTNSSKTVLPAPMCRNTIRPSPSRNQVVGNAFTEALRAKPLSRSTGKS
jgi:hypothetical protein